MIKGVLPLAVGFIFLMAGEGLYSRCLFERRSGYVAAKAKSRLISGTSP